MMGQTCIVEALSTNACLGAVNGFEWYMARQGLSWIHSLKSSLSPRPLLSVATPWAASNATTTACEAVCQVQVSFRFACPSPSQETSIVGFGNRPRQHRLIPDFWVLDNAEEERKCWLNCRAICIYVPKSNRIMLIMSDSGPVKSERTPTATPTTTTTIY